MAEPENLTHRLLREMRAEMTGQFESLRAEVRENTKRLESVRQMALGESVLGRYTVAEVEERLQEIERRLAVLEHGRS